MEKKIKFSIIVPVYKAERYLDDCVSSVVAQEYRDFELLLVDDGSPDRSGEMCDRWAETDGRIIAIHKPNGGQLSARCRGLEAASGDHIMFLDSDDRLAGGALNILYDSISGTDCDCVIYSAVKELNDEIIERAICAEELCGRLICDKRLVYSTVLNDGSYNAVYRKCAKAKCFDGRDYSEYYHVRHGEDLIQSLEILENADSFLFLPDVLYLYRCNPESVTQSIKYDDVRVDNTVDKFVDAFIARTGVLGAEDIDRLQNTRLDRIAIALRSRIRFCSSEEKAVASMERLRNDEYISALLDKGYVSLTGEGGGLRQRLYRENIRLFKNRNYRALIKMDRLMVRLKK